MLARIKDHIKYLYWKYEEEIVPVAVCIAIGFFCYFAYGVDASASLSM